MRDGLDHVLSDVPVRTGYLDASAGLTSKAGAYLRLEAGYRLAQQLGLFGFGQATRQEWMAGFGARVTF